MKPILILDNYDSFTYNIAHIVHEVGYEVEIYLNDKITLDHVEHFDKIILSPGLGIPSEAGILLPLIKQYAPTKSIIGICLGHQAIGEAFGARLKNMETVFHGIKSTVDVVADEPLFHGLESELSVGRYHSWVIDTKDFPDSLHIIATERESRQIMGLRHKEYDVCGVQFHPESVLTPQGKQIIENWLKL